MTIKKGDTLYRISTGEPMRVLKTRKRPNNITRLYLAELGMGYVADDIALHSDDTLVGSYTATQTPELATRWADTLKARAEVEARWEAARVKDTEKWLRTFTYALPVRARHPRRR
jgi:hypothetical protein